jgi:predicted DNA-binding ribbon-helix-helix protein
MDKMQGNTGNTLIGRNVKVAGHRTSMRLEAPMWDAVYDIARRERISVNELCTLVDQRREPEQSLTSAVRVAVLVYFRTASTEDGHQRAGHGNGFQVLVDTIAA